MGGTNKQKLCAFGVGAALLAVTQWPHPEPATASPGDGPIWSQVEFGRSKPPYKLSHGGVQVTVEVPPPSDEESSATARIQAPGFTPIAVREHIPGGQYPRAVGIGKLAPGDQIPSVLLQMYTGGAHCCALITAVVPVDGKLQTVELPTMDGEGLEAFPRDMDGDGVADFVRFDDRFLYAFSSYARSSPPPQVLNVVGGKVVDVSTRPSFSRLFEKAAAKAKADCADRTDTDRNGACASYVAAAARLGRYDQAMREAEALANKRPGIELPTQCKVELVDYECPPGKENRFETFAAALRWFLQENGYISASAERL